MSKKHINTNSNDAASNQSLAENDEFYTVKELFKRLEIFTNNFPQESIDPEMIERFFYIQKLILMQLINGVIQFYIMR